ncbi:MAG TPA: Fic family protein [Polyangiaceae bacterium]|nr:Fic family protein [Polyangiaceae bacterium]
MNSYYSNRIEGQHTRPVDIERALTQSFDADRELARKQRLAVAHIEAEAALEATLPPERSALYAPEYVKHIHAELYQRLPKADRKDHAGAVVVPGAWRETQVTAGNHLAPPPGEIPTFLNEWQGAYATAPGIEQSVVAAACSHHRLTWVHPFLDGNGRTARLHTHLVLTALGLTHGIWSPLRGMASDQEGYYARLNNADLERRNDLDGRGPLSQEGLVAFASWLLDVCLDQARFMRELLGLEALKERIRDLLLWLEAHPWQIGSEKSVVKGEALEALHYVAIFGAIERARFTAMTGLPPRTARRVLTSLLDFGVLSSAGPRATVRFSVPLRSLRFVFPRLWPEAETDSA